MQTWNLHAEKHQNITLISRRETSRSRAGSRKAPLWEFIQQGTSVCVYSQHLVKLCTDVDVVSVARQTDLFFFIVTCFQSPFEIKWERMVITLITCCITAVEQDVRERDAGCNLNTTLRQSALQARRGQSVAQLVWHREWHQDREFQREMLARVKEFDGDVDKLLVEYQQDVDIAWSQNSPNWSLIRSSIRSSRIVLTSRDEYCNERRDKNRLECGFEFKCVFGSRFEYGFEYGNVSM